MRFQQKVDFCRRHHMPVSAGGRKKTSGLPNLGFVPEAEMGRFRKQHEMDSIATRANTGSGFE